MKVKSSSERIQQPRIVSFPTELLALIFKYVPETSKTAKGKTINNILALALVTRSWTPTAQSILFHSPRPDSSSALRRLARSLIANRELTGYVKQLTPPDFYMCTPLNPSSRREIQKWTPHHMHIGSECIELSYKDYLSIGKLLGDIANMCPNIADTSLPWCSRYGHIGIGQFAKGSRKIGGFGLMSLNLNRITHLTITPHIFCHWHSPPNSVVAQPVAGFPSVTHLTLHFLDLSPRSPDSPNPCVASLHPLDDAFSFPALAHLKLSHVTGIHYPTFTIRSAKRAMRSIEIAVSSFCEEDLYELLLIPLPYNTQSIIDKYGSKVSLSTAPLPSSSFIHTITELTMPAFNPPITTANMTQPIWKMFSFRPLPRLRVLHLYAHEHSCYLPLQSGRVLENLEELRISYKGCFWEGDWGEGIGGLVGAVREFVAHERLEGRTNLKRVEIRWRCMRHPTTIGVHKAFFYLLALYLEAMGIEMYLEVEAYGDFLTLTQDEFAPAAALLGSASGQAQRSGLEKRWQAKGMKSAVHRAVGKIWRH